MQIIVQVNQFTTLLPNAIHFGWLFPPLSRRYFDMVQDNNQWKNKTFK